MSLNTIENVNILSQEVLPTPGEVKAELPLTEKALEVIEQGRKTVQDILDRKDPRVFAVVGPCSIHDVDAAKDYAQRLAKLADEVKDTMVLIMRVYFEKPRTSIGWKGLINDPDLDDSFHIEKGLKIARQLLIDLSELGLPTATEALDPISPQYIGDVISWTAIGARTTESQTHREMSSGLSSPVGFKNGTDGGLDVAINALHSVTNPHNFLGINRDGQVSVIRTAGNQYGHVVLRGGKNPNYDSVSIAQCEQALEKANVAKNIVVDCSHANSNKDAALQPLVFENCINQIVEGNQSIVGFMLESNIGFGNQKLNADRSKMEYGVSVTDACIDWATTEKVIKEAHEKLKPVLKPRSA